jgi:hypothetical protein
MATPSTFGGAGASLVKQGGLSSLCIFHRGLGALIWFRAAVLVRA